MKPLIIVGGGIAGSALAYFATKEGLETVLVDAGKHAASDVPSALINAVRGQNGHVVEGGLEGARFTFALLDELSAAGFEVPHSRAGIYRPVPDEKTFLKWMKNLPENYPHEWLEQAPAEVHLQEHWYRVLYLPVGGWVDGQAFCAALRIASGARVIRQTAVSIVPDRVVLQDQTALEGTVVFCGGSYGASQAGFAGTHRRGSLLLLQDTLSPLPVSFGIYATPARKGGVLGSTFETPEDRCSPQGLPLKSLNWLLEKARLTFRTLEPNFSGVWTGVRYSGATLPEGLLTLTALGSKGFLLGPKLARDMVQQTLIPLLHQ
ncbi:NAD(P)/FAD-dependent oxidoreductase [Deinococcus cellulosilyticus]|uniref:Oxidoreductase n=1 Tax=Deinococcus cellulosilyticus (strain DSM 18568 / NBRC 106333 / KACC 11606 / 5516J-15) TaxID=1223518 RepID=A0A511NAF6_DEIC1|nr:FAD-dependent oxidoreductase [Deinococcus cellulosilyticus]GEM49809.1 oxidoreductase [Deinococcus cellulosilyticus NBRC 106333 = KACC 11606]